MRRPVGPSARRAQPYGEGRAAERLTFEDREPDLDLVEPGSAGRREVEADVGMALEPEISLGFMGAQVVEHDMNGLARIGGDDVVHEVEELDPPAPRLMRCGHFA